eukprot:c6451_g1_i1.p1 GENE.c6451_g1_i1~~c6451_g1_i1.p1  ORF type:complete len:459 (+),score=69.70 c6451_g1_i1:204-1379(+)
MGVPETKKPIEAPIAKKSKWDDVIVRVGWSLIMAGTFTGIIIMGHVFVFSLVLLLQSALYHELSILRRDLEKERKLPAIKFVRWYFFFVMMLYGHGRSLKLPVRHLLARLNISPEVIDAHEFVCYILYSLGIVLFVLTLRKGYFRYQFGTFAWSHMTLLLVILQTSWMSANIFRGMIWFVLPAFLVICNDSSAYVFGRAFGRTPLIKLSPKKTWEGFIGATIFTFIFAFWLSNLLAGYDHMICPKETFDTASVECEHSAVFEYAQYHLPAFITQWLSIDFVWIRPVQFHALVLALFASSIAPFGGFFASGFKRALKKKDFGDVIPGHGGMADRFDCQILMAAFAYFYVQTFLSPNRFSAVAVIQILKQLNPETQLEVFKWLSNQLNSQGMV